MEERLADIALLRHQVLVALAVLTLAAALVIGWLALGAWLSAKRRRDEMIAEKLIGRFAGELLLGQPPMLDECLIEVPRSQRDAFRTSAAALLAYDVAVRDRRAARHATRANGIIKQIEEMGR